MFELWARKRPVNGIGSQYQLIESFENEIYKYTAVDKLDRSIYQEAMVTSEDKRCVLHREFEKPYVKAIKPE